MRPSKLRRQEIRAMSRKAASLSSAFIYDAVEKAIPNPTYREIQAYGTAWAAIQGSNSVTYAKLQSAGTKRVSATCPRWYQVNRTDTTDYVNRSKAAVNRSRRYLKGE